jgi:hypothetical protein
MKFNIPPSSHYEKQIATATQEAMHYKALYDDLIDELKGKGYNLAALAVYKTRTVTPLQSTTTTRLPRPLIERLIAFCHPDKNQGRESLAGELTKELLKIRDLS